MHVSASWREKLKQNLRINFQYLMLKEDIMLRNIRCKYENCGVQFLHIYFNTFSESSAGTEISDMHCK